MKVNLTSSLILESSEGISNTTGPSSREYVCLDMNKKPTPTSEQPVLHSAAGKSPERDFP